MEKFEGADNLVAEMNFYEELVDEDNVEIALIEPLINKSNNSSVVISVPIFSPVCALDSSAPMVLSSSVSKFLLSTVCILLSC